MNKKCLLSVIIPVYNVERYIKKCLNSIISQISYLNFGDVIELLIVNDGTQDGSMLIVEEIAHKYDFVRIINQENKGLSAARNEGLKRATGKYVWFFDSDDYLKSNTLKKIIDNLSSDHDLYVLGIEHVDEKGRLLEDYMFPNVDEVYDLLADNVFMAQLYIVRREILLNNVITFYENIYHEDMEFTPRMLTYIRNFKRLDFVAYCYLKRDGSITMGKGGKYNIKRAYDIFKIIKSLAAFRKKLNKIWKKRFSYIISLAMNNILQEEYRLSKNECQEINKLFYKNKKYFLHFFMSYKLKYVFEGLTFFIEPRKSVQIFRLLKQIK